MVTDWSGLGLGWLGLTFAWLVKGRWLRIRLMRYERFEGCLWAAFPGLVLRGAGLGLVVWGYPQLSWVCSLAFGFLWRELWGVGR
jgi:hypothetical protein